MNKQRRKRKGSWARSHSFWDEVKESLIPIINHNRNSENSWKVPEPVLPIPSNSSEGLSHHSSEGVLYPAWGAGGVKSARSLGWDWTSNVLTSGRENRTDQAGPDPAKAPGE